MGGGVLVLQYWVLVSGFGGFWFIVREGIGRTGHGCGWGCREEVCVWMLQGA